MSLYTGPNFKAKFPVQFFVVIAVVVLFVLYIPMMTRDDVPLPNTVPLLATEPAVPLPPNVRTFCNRVAEVRNACKLTLTECSRYQRERFAGLLGNANLCTTNPTEISIGDAALLLQSFRPEPLCCFN